MAISISDYNGNYYLLGDLMGRDELLSPVVSEKRHTFSYPFGDATLTQIGFSGIYIVYGDMLLKHKLRLTSLDEPDMVELHFALTGGASLHNLLTGRHYSFRKHEHNMIYSNGMDAIGEFPPERYRFLEVHFSVKRFLELTENSSNVLMRFAEKVAAHQHADLSDQNLPLTLPMLNCIHDIMNCRFTGGLKLLFLQSKCVELLALQAQAVEDAQEGRRRPLFKTAQDKAPIYFAREYLLQHIDQPPSLQALAKIAGINEFKLKQGFRELFNNTVFGYLNDHKLEQARQLLYEKQHNITEIALELGYSSVHHFSKAFKKKFGIPPSKIN